MPRTDSAPRLLVFAKAPLAGHVKTRLIPLLGRDGAAKLHAVLVEHTLAVATESPIGALELHGAPADNEFLRACAVRHGARLVDQSAGDLGARMHAALERALAQSSSAILIGTDCPAMTADYLQQAAAALHNGNDVVLGPVEDGGYALIGARRIDDAVFRDISWSTGSVIDETRARLRQLMWRWAELPTLWDVDGPCDYERLRASGLVSLPMLESAGTAHTYIG